MFSNNQLLEEMFLQILDYLVFLANYSNHVVIIHLSSTGLRSNFIPEYLFNRFVKTVS